MECTTWSPCRDGMWIKVLLSRQESSNPGYPQCGGGWRSFLVKGKRISGPSFVHGRGLQESPWLKPTPGEDRRRRERKGKMWKLPIFLLFGLCGIGREKLFLLYYRFPQSLIDLTWARNFQAINNERSFQLRFSCSVHWMRRNMKAKSLNAFGFCHFILLGFLISYSWNLESSKLEFTKPELLKRVQNS